MPADDETLYETWLDFDAPDRYSDPGSFEHFLDVYHSSGAGQEDPVADEDMFYQFLNAFVPEDEPQTAEYWEAIREEFYEMAEITGEDIDWEEYREAIGYGENE